MPSTEDEEPRSMTGKVCLVTGATSGIGRIAARELASKGATVVLVGRNLQRCQNAVEAIRMQTGNDAVGAILADLSLQADVRRVADAFRERFDRLDVLLNNAGALFLDRQVTAEGLERTFALNHLSFFSLTNLLLDVLRRSAPARIINVSSGAHRWIRRIDFDNLQGEKSYSGFHAYALSKLENLLFTYETDRRIRGSGVTVNALHPGFVASNFLGGRGMAWWLMRRSADLFAISPERGARTSVYLATNPEVEGLSGRFFIKEKEATSSPLSHDEAAAQRLWDISVALSGIPATV